MSDFQDHLFGKVTGDMDAFKKILSKIPGFSGYMERQARRDSDKLLRETIFTRFRELEGRVSALQRDFISKGEIGYVDDMESIAIKLRTFADRVRNATYGYSGLFDAVKVNEEELAAIYQYDAAMLDLVDELNRSLDNIEAAIGTDGLQGAIRALEGQARQCIETFDRRQEVILGGAPE